MKNLPLIFVLLFLFVFILPLGVRPLINPDETRYAEIGREMNVNQNYVSPKLNGVRYFEKPVMGYWLFAGSMKLFGENAFAVRLPVALAAGLSAWLLYLLACHFAGGSRMGLLSAGIFLTMPMTFLLASVAILDGIFSLFLTACLALFYYTITDFRGRFWRQVPLLFVVGVFAGCAFLTKGFLAFVLPGIVAFAFLVWEKRWKELLYLPWIPLVGALAVIAPWAYLIHLQEPDYWRYFVIVEHWNRMTGGTQAQHQEPFFFFLPVLVIGAVTWVIMGPSIYLGLRQLSLKTPFLRYCVCWCVMPLLFLSCSSGKLPTYIQPCFAPLAILMAIGIYKYVIAEKNVRLINHTALAFAGALLLAAVGFTVQQFTAIGGRTLYVQGELWKWLIVVIAGMFCMIGFLLVRFEKDYWNKVLFFVASFLPVILAAHFILPNMIIERKVPSVMLSGIRQSIPKGMEIVSHQNPFQAVCWEFKRDDVWIVMEQGEIAYGLQNHETDRFLDQDAFHALLNRSVGPGKPGLLLVLPADKAERFFQNSVGFPPVRRKWEPELEKRKGYVVYQF